MVTRPKVKHEPHRTSEAEGFAAEANSGVDWANHNQFMQIVFAEEGLLFRFIEKQRPHGAIGEV